MENSPSSNGKIRKNMSSLLISRNRKKTDRMSSSLLDRLREAVFRLIMLSALSSSGKGSRQRVDSQQPTYHSGYLQEPHRSEDVADCIEFIKKYADSSESRDSMNANPEVVIPVPVM